MVKIDDKRYEMSIKSVNKPDQIIVGTKGRVKIINGKK
jgi:hypothetical protein